MNERTPWIVAGVAGAIAVLAISFAAITADNDEIPGRADNDYMGMMRAFGRMDSEDMLSRMQSLLGEKDYAEMLEHLAEHRTGRAMPYAPGVDGMMHRMMDGFFEQMPADENNIMPMGPMKPR